MSGALHLNLFDQPDPGARGNRLQDQKNPPVIPLLQRGKEGDFISQLDTEDDRLSFD
jgi:hypothetical protein